MVEGKITATEDVLVGEISLNIHRHSEVQSGCAQTGAPV
ncbi:hypothetical protein [Novosphingobium sp. M1R2S20]|uniref:Polymer-forming protein n=1 Tax=Novosphingobium rhizovicinum TaxID=3228928 RepID=A0ABV3R721_9SPHN